ncbi:bifunctional DNA primase/polymerase [Streptomyces sp. NPDC059835]|uniref:bifunctional DNA primase/polymerase n=1 Tax=Streptomyces sp. NPDC059835 TaxID=3346967 RepID=UPI00366210D9
MVSPLMDQALHLAGAGIPVIPLGGDKTPLANCWACQGNRCGERPNSLTRPGPCRCPGSCHGWSAASTDAARIARWGWHRARAIGWAPGMIGVTVVDADNAEAVAWATSTLPATRTVPTKRGAHLLYLGATQTRDAVYPHHPEGKGLDAKSLGAYCVWYGVGEGDWAALPQLVKDLRRPVREGKGSSAVVAASVPPGSTLSTPGSCAHPYPQEYLRRGVAYAEGALKTLPTEDGTGRKAAAHRVLSLLMRNQGCHADTATLDGWRPHLEAVLASRFGQHAGDTTRPHDAARVWEWAMTTAATANTGGRYVPKKVNTIREKV